ncbi:MAG TPA: polysaccharide deacetylase family protein [Ktedonobacteraceae bacterium]
MDLVAFSIRTKGLRNFARRLWTVFSRFGFSERRIRKALYAIIDTSRKYSTAPTFFIPAVVLHRHPALIAKIARDGTELGIHGYVHNDYRFLNEEEQYKQTQQAISVFEQVQIPFHGFRNPYLGWTEETLRVFAALNFAYESNEAVLHDVIDVDALSPLLRSGYEKSLALFQAMPCTAYTLRPHFEGELLRIPTSIPDDEMLFDRLRVTNPNEVGKIWSQVMQRVYDLGGLYTLNLHPERGVLCQQALNILLSYAHTTLQSVWLARLQDITQWWKTRSQFSFNITSLADQVWQVEATCTPEATLLARHLVFENEDVKTQCVSSSGDDVRVEDRQFTIRTLQAPCIALSLQTPQLVEDFLREQGYPFVRCQPEEAERYALYLDLPQGLGNTREEQVQQRSELVQQVEHLDAPLVRFACWPNGYQAALTVSGDIDSITIQDFFLRILEVR